MELRVRVNRDWLLEALKANREGHQSLYDEAVVGFEKECEEKLQKALAKGRAKNWTESTFISLTPPKNNIAEYNTAISMFENSVDEHVELMSSQYKNFVEDDWGWSRSWLAENAAYSTGCATTYQQKYS